MPYHARVHNDGQKDGWKTPFPDLMTWNDFDAVAACLSDIAPSWSADLNQTSLDDSSIVVTPEGASDLIGPAFVLFRENGVVRLDQFRWDEYRKIGGFASLEEALAAMASRLLASVSRLKPGAAVDL